MCGIVGYVGHRQALDVVLGGLRRLEYRGYDSAGVAVLTGDTLATERKAGRLANLEAELDRVGRAGFAGTAGMGHTRWATHGAPVDRNSHPHSDTTGRLAVVHNGIIENFAALRRELEAEGIELSSDTDTETAAHLIARAYDSGETAGDLPASVRAVCRRLDGAFTLVVTHADEPDQVVAARRSSPLVVGVGDQECFVASDVAAFIEYTRDAVELGQDQLVVITRSGYEVTDFDGEPAVGKPFRVSWDLSAAVKGGHDYFMLKEIEEQPAALANTLRGHFTAGRIVLDEQRMSDQDLRDVDKVFVVACGSAYHSGLVAKYAIEHWTRLPVEVELASEFRYRDPVLDRDTLVVAVSQSGETADTLEAVRHARVQKAQGAGRLQHQRRPDPARVRRRPLHARRPGDRRRLHQGVPGADRGQLPGRPGPGAGEGHEVPGRGGPRVRRAGGHARRRPAGARHRRPGPGSWPHDLAESKAVLFLGRHVGYPVALEGALKLKELAYMHAEGFAGGELKHGPIALIEDGLPVVVVMPSPKGRAVLHNEAAVQHQQIQARGARTIVIAEEGDDTVRPFADHLIEVPAVPTLLQPLVSTVPLQVLAAEIARSRGYDVDKPRNLAKSVTVE